MPSEARDRLYRLLDEAASDHQPVLITGLRSSAVLFGEEDWNAIQETLYLLSVPGMRDSIIIDGLALSPDQCEANPAGDALAAGFQEAGAETERGALLRRVCAAPSTLIMAIRDTLLFRKSLKMLILQHDSDARRWTNHRTFDHLLLIVDT